MLPPLPDADLDTSRPLGARFAAQGAWTYRDAARLVWGLPVGRPRQAGLDAVLKDGRGTRSQKHALLAALAAEVDLPVDLRIGLFEMTEATAPGVGPVLATYRLAAVPEAIVVLGVGDERIDLTWPGATWPVPPMVSEEIIRPEQVGTVEASWHRRHADAWAEARGLDPDAVWAARQAAVAALAEG